MASRTKHHSMLLCIGWMVATAVVLIVSLTVTAIAADKTPAKGRSIQARGVTWRVGQPLTHDNLTVFPVYGREQRKVGSQYLTLGEALKEQLIVVKEMPSAEVNRVSVTNKASKALYLMSGDIILGGQQDRVIARDTIVPKAAHNFVVEVFCVEHGRWHGGQHFAGNEIASSSLRRETQESKAQEKVWGKVAQEAARTRSQTQSGTYRAVAANYSMQQQIAAYTKSLGSRLAKDRRALGLVVAINGKVTAADLFADPHLFQQQLPKILKSHALDAAQEKAGWAKLSTKPKPSTSAAQQLLKDADTGAKRTTARTGATINSERENSSTVVFDAAPQGPASGPAGAAAEPAHRNIYRK